jgi:hypothetical protein
VGSLIHGLQVDKKIEEDADGTMDRWVEKEWMMAYRCFPAALGHSSLCFFPFACLPLHRVHHRVTLVSRLII